MYSKHMISKNPLNNNWQPPADYKPVNSAIEGIIVYAPRTIEDSMGTPTTYKCPNCGATTRYDVAEGGVTCEYCGYNAPVKADQVGQKAAIQEFTLETLDKAEQGWGVTRRELHCDSCGAEIAVEETAITSTCPFCASNKVNVIAPHADQLRPRFLVPFKIQPKVCRDLSAEWLGKGWFHPNELTSTTVLARFMGVYLPFWTFSAHITSAWKAEVGYEHQERYYDHSSKEWKTRTVINWRWEKGRVAIKINDLLVNGSSHISRVILDRIHPFNLTELVAYSPDFLAGWQAHAFDISLPTAWEHGKAIMRDNAKKACYRDIPTSHVRNFSMTADFAEEVWRYILLPIYIAAYKFEDKVYQMMVNGQTGSVAGQKPVAWWKIWLAIAGLFSPGLLFGLIGLVTLLFGGIGILFLVISVILLIIGGFLSFRIYQQAVASEAS